MSFLKERFEVLVNSGTPTEEAFDAVRHLAVGTNALFAEQTEAPTRKNLNIDHSKLAKLQVTQENQASGKSKS